jgi:hypothetical protein
MDSFHVFASEEEISKKTECIHPIQPSFGRGMDATRQLKLAIAKIAYKEIQAAIDKFEGLLISVHWDECITVDGELFHGHELRE